MAGQRLLAWGRPASSRAFSSSFRVFFGAAALSFRRASLSLCRQIGCALLLCTDDSFMAGTANGEAFFVRQKPANSNAVCPQLPINPAYRWQQKRRFKRLFLLRLCFSRPLHLYGAFIENIPFFILDVSAVLTDEPSRVSKAIGVRSIVFGAVASRARLHVIPLQ